MVCGIALSFVCIRFKSPSRTQFAFPLSAVQVQWAAVRTTLEEIKVPPQSHKIPSELSKPMAAMCGNSFASAFLPPTISLRVFRAHSDMLTGFRFPDRVGGMAKPKTASAFSAHFARARDPGDPSNFTGCPEPVCTVGCDVERGGGCDGRLFAVGQHTIGSKPLYPQVSLGNIPDSNS